MDVKKKPAGKQILEHDALKLDLEDDIIEYRRAMEPDIMRRINDTIQRTKNTPLYGNKDFYVVMLIVDDRVLRHPRTVIFARRSCPTPVYKQSVWKYLYNTGKLEFLWSIPDGLLYYHILNNREKYLGDKECSQLAKFVILMESGELTKWVIKENGEKIDAVIFTNKENECLMN